MGSTRKRVTVLVLSLEALGLCMLGLSVYLAGEVRLGCERAAGVVECHASEHRFLGLVTWHRRSYGAVTEVTVEPPALGRSDHWLSVVTAEGPRRVLPGNEVRTRRDVERLRAFLDGSGDGGGNDPEKIRLGRSAAPVALAAALFGCLWIAVISLIMREFLGYHTPWWWSFGRRE